MFTIQNFNFGNNGYYINLESSTDRKSHIEELKNKYNIQNLNRFEALTDEMIQYSCTKSHLGVFQDALNNDYEVIFVCEDDMDINDECYLPNIQTKPSFSDLIPQIYNDLQNVEWDVLLFGCNPKSSLIPVTNTLAKIDRSTGAWAYLIKKRAYEYVINNLNYRRDLLAIDDFLPRLNDVGFVTLTTIPMIINHAVGFVSTLQPRGPVNYDVWIQGNYDKFIYSNYNMDFTEERVEKDITIVIAGHFVENYIYYLNYLLHSLPNELLKCKFLIHYDEWGSDDINLEKYKLNAYFRDTKSELNVTVTTGFGGLISTFKNVIDRIKTPYFIFLEHDWVFLKKDNIDFLKLTQTFKKYDFVHSVWFSKDDNTVRGFDIAKDVESNVTPFDREYRIDNVDLITVCRWSNNPAMFRLSKFKEWFDKYINNEYVGTQHQGQHNVEEMMIPIYRKIISENKWEDIKDDWGTYLYGDLGEGPYVGHTDASRRYQGASKSEPEYNGEEYIKNNPI
jgi:hypothetical protein